MSLAYNSILGLLILVADIWAIINIFQSSVSNEKKLIWIIVVVLLPVLGLILWFFLGPRDRKPSPGNLRLLVGPPVPSPAVAGLHHCNEQMTSSSESTIACPRRVA